MANGGTGQKSAKNAVKKVVIPETTKVLRKTRNFPKHNLEQALVVAQKIQDEMGGKPMNRLLLADALGLSPSSSNFRDILSSSFKYGLTDGTERAVLVILTEKGIGSSGSDPGKRLASSRAAALMSPVFGQFFGDYANKKVPSSEMLPKVLHTSYNVPSELTAECASLIEQNGAFVKIIRQIGGSAHVLLDAESSDPDLNSDLEQVLQIDGGTAKPPLTSSLNPNGPAEMDRISSTDPAPGGHKPIFVAHGKNKVPLQQLQALLSTFQIPHKVVVDEANLGRPISQKVRDTLQECGSAILIFTRDEQFTDKAGVDIWRPSENVVYELGATSYLYGDRIVIFKEKGIHFPTNFQNIGYIEFESNDIQARTADLLKELIGFGLVRVTPT